MRHGLASGAIPALLSLCMSGTTDAKKPPASEDLLIAQLGAPAPKDRLNAAKGIGPTPSAAVVKALVDAVKAETEPKVLFEEMRALGKTGAPQARTLLLKYVRHPDKKVSKNATAALELWDKAAPFYKAANADDAEEETADEDAGRKRKDRR